MASSGVGEPVQYLYSPEMDDDEFYHPEVMLTHPTNILSLDNNNSASVLPDGQLDDGDAEEYYLEDDANDENEVELSPGGVLDEETIARGMSNFGRNADGTQHVYLNLTVSGHGIVDIGVLQTFVHLQKVDVSYNNLTDISPLSCIHHIIELDASHNQLTSCLKLDPEPKNLRIADFSFNAITEIPDLSAYACLERLNLDNNQISAMRGLSNCKRLKCLSLAHNHIKMMQGMGGLDLRYLNLKYNEIKSLDNLETLTNLQTIIVSGNKIRSLQGLQKHQLLETVDLEANEIIDVAEIKFIKDLYMLRSLNLLRNPIQELPDYRLLILYRVPRLKDLDNRKIEVKEKVSANNLFDPPMEVIAQRDHIMHVVYQFLQPKRIMESTLPSVERPYPMLVLCGPQGAGKKALAQKLVEEFSDYFGYGVCHTTRKRLPDEVHGKDYKFVSIDEFEDLIKLGCFIETDLYNRQWYGLSTDSIESVAAEGLATVVNMELEGVLTLKKTHFSPRYVLILPLSRESHEKRLRGRGFNTEAQLQEILNRTSMYTDWNQEHPGFFDCMINSDDIGDAYKSLRALIMEYLGMGAALVEGSIRSGSRGSDRNSQSSLPKPDSRPMSKYNKMPNLHDSTMSKGSVLEASFIRRKEQAKDAVMGFIPSLYEQIINKMPRTAPADLPTQLGIHGSGPKSPLPFPTATELSVGDSSSSSSSSSSSGSGSSSGKSSSTSSKRSAISRASVTRDEDGLPLGVIDSIELLSHNGESMDMRPGSGLSSKYNILPPIKSPPLQ